MEKHTALFLGKKVKLRYRAYQGFIGKYHRNSPTIEKIYDFVNWHILTESELDNPPLIVGDEVYLHTLNQKASIEDVVRSTDNKYVYYLDHKIEVVEDEITISSKKESEEELPRFMQEYNKRLQECQEDKETESKKKWSIFG